MDERAPKEQKIDLDGEAATVGHITVHEVHVPCRTRRHAHTYACGARVYVAPPSSQGVAVARVNPKDGSGV